LSRRSGANRGAFRIRERTDRHVLIIYERDNRLTIAALAVAIEQVVASMAAMVQGRLRPLRRNGRRTNAYHCPGPGRTKRPVPTRRQLRQQCCVPSIRPMSSGTPCCGGVLSRFGTSRRTGLSANAAETALAKFGPNVLPKPSPLRWSIFFGQFNSLPSASRHRGGHLHRHAALRRACHHRVVAINATIGYITRASPSAPSIPQDLTRPSATLVRDGAVLEIGAEQVVPAICSC